MTQIEENRAALIKIVAENFKLNVPVESLNGETKFFEGGLELDSFGLVEMVQHIETVFGIQLSDMDFAPENFADIDTLAGVVARYQQAA